MKLSQLKKCAVENGINLKHLNGKMLKKSELAEKLMSKGIMVKSPKKSKKRSRKSKKKSRKSKKKSRKSKKKSRKSKKKSRKLNVYMIFAAKHRKNVMKKFKDQGKSGRDLISATGKELGRMYRAQKPKASRKMSKKKSRKMSKKKSRKMSKKKSRKMSKKKSRKMSKKKSRKKKSRKKKSRKKKSRKKSRKYRAAFTYDPRKYDTAIPEHKKKKSREYKMHKYGGNEGDLRRSARKDYM